MLKISILTDNPKSWILPFVEKIKTHLAGKYELNHCFSFDDIVEGEIAFFLGCERIVPGNVLSRNKHNIVIHPSDLPKGKGFSPLAWQILEGENSIPIVLFEAVEEVDAGVIYYKDILEFQGNELNDDIKDAQGRKTVELVLRFLESYPDVPGIEQSGKGTVYPRRTTTDSELDIDKSIKDQFNLLRVVDNEKYPAFFELNGYKYILKIYPSETKQD